MYQLHEHAYTNTGMLHMCNLELWQQRLEDHQLKVLNIFL